MRDSPTATELYLDLLKDAVMGQAFVVRGSALEQVRFHSRRSRWVLRPLQAVLALRDIRLAKAVSDETHDVGSGWTTFADTMIGRRRLDNIQECIESVLEDDVPGDLIETGVWRGGATIFMRGVLAAYGVHERTVWVADSFEGLPPPDLAKFPADRGLDLSQFDELAVDLETVQDNFRRYRLLDGQVRFLAGWFKDTLPTAPIDQLAVLRLDGDYYESTWDSLTSLYPKLSHGGYVIVDDFGVIAACRQAVMDYRAERDIGTPIVEIDHSGIFWRKQ